MPGLILVLIGGIFLLHNYGYVHVHWMNFLYLWPIFIIIGGVNMIFAHNRSPWASAIKIGVVIIGFGLLLFGNFGSRYRFWPQTYTFDNNNDDDDDSDSTRNNGVVKVEGNSFFNEPYSADARIAELNISGGGTTYTLNDTTNQLFSANTKEFLGKYEFDRHKTDSTYVLDFNMKQNRLHHFNWGRNNKSNEAILKLNPNPIWDINVEAGATELNFDLTKFKIRKLKLDGGAAAFNVKLGAPLASTNIEVSTGMADVTVRIPKDAACRITTDSGLSSHNFEGFTKKDDDSYETPGFSAAKNKITISIDGGLSDFKVIKY